jgi:hypothetical protein
MEDLKESSDVLLIMFSGNLFQSVIVLGKKDFALYGTQQDIDAIERVQRRAARFVTNKYHNTSSVGNMLQHLEWRSLQVEGIVDLLSYVVYM